MGSILWIPIIFSASTATLYMTSLHLPYTDHGGAIKFPSTLEELSELATFLNAYKEQHHLYVLTLFAMAYLWKQTFAVPGSLFLNLLAGALFGAWVGFPLACVLTACGATNCYLLSHYFGKAYIIRYFPSRIKSFQDKIAENSDSLFFFLLFLRLFPISPNWFMNMVAPILNIPMHQFFLSVFFGLMPYNFICVQTGCFLSQLDAVEDIFSLWTLLKLFVLANAALVPGVLIKRYHERRENQRRLEELERKIRAKEEELAALEREEAYYRGVHEQAIDEFKRRDEERDSDDGGDDIAEVMRVLKDGSKDGERDRDDGDDDGAVVMRALGDGGKDGSREKDTDRDGERDSDDEDDGDDVEDMPALRDGGKDGGKDGERDSDNDEDDTAEVMRALREASKDGGRDADPDDETEILLPSLKDVNEPNLSNGDGTELTLRRKGGSQHH